jgi:hypothetical protein
MAEIRVNAESEVHLRELEVLKKGVDGIAENSARIPHAARFVDAGCGIFAGCGIYTESSMGPMRNLCGIYTESLRRDAGCGILAGFFTGLMRD